MAFDTIEIEIKVKINSSEVAEVKSALNKVAQLSKTEHQIDTYYVPEHENYMAEKYPYKWFSIRSRGDKNILNFKHFYPEGAEKTTHCHEYETAISDAKNMHAILSELKIIEICKVDKKREKYIYQDLYEIVLDDVEGLGTYLEIEALKDLGGPEHTRSEMTKFLFSLGLKELDIDYRGYPYLLIHNAK